MAGPSLGTLLIQRLDAALGTTLSQQTQIVNRASSNPVPHPGQIVKPEPLPNTLVRDARTNVDRATQGSPSGGRVGTPAGTADPALAGPTPGPTVTTSATTSLGTAARIILNLFADHRAGTPPLVARSPLISAAPQATTAALSQALAKALSQSLQQSGLFYESHLRNMIFGQYRLADVHQEPQAQIPTGTARSDPGPIPGVDPASHSLVRQQLEALADQSVHWRGEAWPGTPMEWQIRRPTDEHEAQKPQTETEEPAWQSHITLQLPRLGPVTMDIRLAGAQVYVRLQARDDTLSVLQQHAGNLHGQMSDRQLELTALTFARPDSGNEQ